MAVPTDPQENALTLLMNLINEHSKAVPADHKPCEAKGELIGADMRGGQGTWRLIIWVQDGLAVETFVLRQADLKRIYPDVDARHAREG
jgi:hypothetical protein